MVIVTNNVVGMVYTSDYPIFSVTVDLACLTVREDALQVLLVERGTDPYAGRLALPGGFVKPDEDLETAARRELLEETEVAAPRFLEQLKTYGAPDRDPRGRVVSVAHLAIAPNLGDAVGGSDAASADWHPVEALLADPSRLAFDHGEILADAVDRARGRLEWTPLATDFVDETFTIADLRHVYEVIWGVTLDPANFYRKVTRADGFVEETGRTADAGRGRPAGLYRRGDAQRIYPPLNLWGRRSAS